jgi:hypothetical protein
LRFAAKGSKQLYLTRGYEIFLLLATWGIPVAILPALTGNQDADNSPVSISNHRETVESSGNTVQKGNST